MDTEEKTLTLGKSQKFEVRKSAKKVRIIKSQIVIVFAKYIITNS